MRQTGLEKHLRRTGESSGYRSIPLIASFPGIHATTAYPSIPVTSYRFRVFEIPSPQTPGSANDRR
jgi:hypothetical protein